MLRQLNTLECNQYVNDDPVRPHLDSQFRTSLGRKVYAWDVDGDVQAICCLAFVFDTPKTEEDLELMSFHTEGQPTIVPYTIWSYKPKAGTNLLLALIEKIKADYEDTPSSYQPKIITLSPKTEMAMKFHLSNGARLISENENTNNFEYDIDS